MKRTLIIAALAAAIAGPVAAAQVDNVQAHFNQDYESLSDLRAVTSDDAGVTVSTRNSGLFGDVIAQFNADEDSFGEQTGRTNVTIFDAAPNPIFDAIRAESLENE